MGRKKAWADRQIGMEVQTQEDIAVSVKELLRRRRKKAWVDRQIDMVVHIQRSLFGKFVEMGMKKGYVDRQTDTHTHSHRDKVF